MKLENSFTVPVPVDQAWQVLQDVERIAPCMPGATLDSVEGDSFQGRVKVKVGPIMLTYSGKATFAEKDESAHSMLIEASGKETRGSGTAKATVQARMEAEGDSTKVVLSTDLAVTGKPAQFGRGVMADVSGKLIGQFANCLAQEVQTGELAQATSGDGAAGSAQSSDTTSSASTSSEARVSSAGATAEAPATPPLAPAGAPQEAAPAPPTPAPAAGLGAAAGAGTGQATSGAGTAGAGAATGAQANGQGGARPARPPQQEAIDLLGTAGMPVAKRLIPAVVGVVAVVILVRVLRRR